MSRFNISAVDSISEIVCITKEVALICDFTDLRVGLEVDGVVELTLDTYISSGWEPTPECGILSLLEGKESLRIRSQGKERMWAEVTWFNGATLTLECDAMYWMYTVLNPTYRLWFTNPGHLAPTIEGKGDESYPRLIRLYYEARDEEWEPASGGVK